MYYLNAAGIKSTLEQGHLTIDPSFFTEEYQNTLIDALSYIDASTFNGVKDMIITVSPRISLTGKEDSIILNLGNDYTYVTTGEENDIENQDRRL
jgi:hypothetical protein